MEVILGESGSVSFMFDRVGRIEYLANLATADEIMESAIEGGANDVDHQKMNILSILI